MNNKEKSLLTIAAEIIEMNAVLGAALTGSLMLRLRGFETIREPNDIDIICEYLCEFDEGFPCMPKGYKKIDMEGRKSQVDAIMFENENGIKVDFMQSGEPIEDVSGIDCGSVECLLKAKEKYILTDTSEYSVQKHTLDINFIKSQIIWTTGQLNN